MSSDGELKKRIAESLRYTASNGSINVNLDGVIEHCIHSWIDEAKKDFLNIFERYIKKEFPEYEQYLIAIEECFEKWFGEIPEYDFVAEKWFSDVQQTT